MKKLALLLILSGCVGMPDARHVVDPVEVKVPVLERAEAPKELYRTKTATDTIPRWISPSDPQASSCVSQKDEAKLKVLLLQRESLLDGWENYGSAR